MKTKLMIITKNIFTRQIWRGLCVLVILGWCYTMNPLGAQNEKISEYEVNVLPKGAKFNKESLYQEDEEILQGTFGTNLNDRVFDGKVLPTTKQIVVVGETGDTKNFLKEVPRSTVKGISQDGFGFVLFFEQRARRAEKIVFLPKDAGAPVRVDIDDEGYLYVACSEDEQSWVCKMNPLDDALVWQKKLKFPIKDMDIMADRSVVLMSSSSVSRLGTDGDIVPFGKEESIQLAGSDFKKAYWDGLGYAKAGYSQSKITFFDVGVTADSGIVAVAQWSINLPQGGPDFDPILVKYGLDGKLQWTTNLVQGLPNESDNKNQHLHVCKKTGDIIVSSDHHGHFSLNMIAPEGSYVSNSSLNSGWETGDLMISWIGRVDPTDGKVKAGTFYFSELGGAKNTGKKQANSLFVDAITTDHQGYIYLVGRSAYRFSQTKFTFDSTSQSGPMITVFNPDLSRIKHAGIIFSGPSTSTTPVAVMITELGPVVIANTSIDKKGTQPVKFLAKNHDKTNYLLPNHSRGGDDASLCLIPSFNWFMY